MTHLADRLVRASAWVVPLTFALLVVRLWRFVSEHAVDLVYLDQWDFLQGLMEGADAWTLFRWQHGLARQGPGNLILEAALTRTQWSGMADPALAAGTMALAALGALWLVRRLCGAWRPWDVAVPLLFLTTANVDGYVSVPNLSHGPLQALYLVAFGLAMTVGSHLGRCGLLVAINVFAVNTGYTMLLGWMTPGLLVLSAFRPGLTGRDRAVYAAGAAAAIATLVHFFHDIVFLTAVDCFRFPHDRPREYLSYLGLVLARPFNARALGLPDQLIGSLTGLAAIGFVILAAVGWRREHGATALWSVACMLGGFALLFASSTAVGRVCTGLETAQASRYIPYVLPGLLSVYLVLRSGAVPVRGLPWLLGLFVTLCVLKETSSRAHLDAGTEAALKRAWRDCYLTVHDIDTCDARSGRPAYPSPEATDLQRKLDWLEARGYSLFRSPE